MKKIIALLLFVLPNFVSYGQCSTVSLQVSSSDTTYVQLYHPGFFNIPSGIANICEWEVTLFSGDIIYQETTSGEFNEQSFVLFDHSTPITDSMKATLVITNNVEGITCTINDTLFWNETEVIPGVFVGNWDVLSSNGGVEEDITTSKETLKKDQGIELFPSPADDYFQIKSDRPISSFTIFDINGQTMGTFKHTRPHERVDIPHYPAGIYFVHFWDESSRSMGVKKVVKL